MSSNVISNGNTCLLRL